MSYRAVLLDFYGTLVEEDDVHIARIAEQVARASPLRPEAREVGARWSREFARGCTEAWGPSFRPQREIELESLRQILREFEVGLDPVALSQDLFRYWCAPEPRPGAGSFLADLELPVCVVSNIDSGDLALAIEGLGWSFDAVVTSESSRAYKPRRELFETALATLGCAADQVMHVGDSLRADVAGAAALGIATAWVNRSGRPHSGSPAPSRVVADVWELARDLRT